MGCEVVAYVQTGPNEQKVWFYVNFAERPCRVTSNERTFLIAVPGLTP